MINPTKQHEISSPLIFKSCHSLGKGQFLVAGGMYAMSNAPSSHSCAMAAYDSITREWVWATNLPKNRIIDYSCVCGDVAVGGISSATRRVSSGLVCIDVTSGSQIGEFESLPALNCLGCLEPDDWIAGTWVDDSQLHFYSRKSKKISIVVSDDPGNRIRGLTGVGSSRFISTMQRTQDSKLRFVHQLRDAKNCIYWNYESEGETVIRCENDIIAVYSDVSSARKSQIELLDVSTGKVAQKFSVREPLASLTHLYQDYCVYCNESYEAVFAAEFGSKPLAKFGFPNKVDGWLTFAVDRDTRTVFACKGNNCQDPSSLISIFEF